MSHIELTRKETVRQHINSFPRVEAHYCRKDTKKEYLDSELSLAEMYMLYKVTVDKSLFTDLFSTLSLIWNFSNQERIDVTK